MRKKISAPILAVLLFLFFWVNLPKDLVDWIRNLAVSPFWTSTKNVEEVSRLQTENQILRNKLEQVCGRLQLEKGPDSFLPAQVIYRDPSSWSSSVWVNVGTADNQALGENSPVLAEGALVGVLDYVGEKQSRVRLITDSALCPSVRAVRGKTQNRELQRALQALLGQIEKREDLFSASLQKELLQLKERIGQIEEDQYLAKGEIHGSSAPLWRSRSPILKGIGFNYDYDDEKGPARELRSEILKEGDFLVTTGLDGVFPPNLRVGTVARVHPLKQGSYCYNIEVKPAIPHLNDLQTLFILPPQ